MWLSVTSATWNDLELGDYVERYLVDKFSSVKMLELLELVV